MPSETGARLTHPLRGIDRLGALLAGVAGATDAIGVLAFGRYTAHMSGTTSQTVAYGLSGAGQVALGVGTILCFVAGAALCGTMAEASAGRPARRTLWRLLSAEAVLLALAATLLAAAPVPLLALVPMAFAMGLQNATGSRLLGPTIRTTHVTGTLTDLGGALGALMCHDPDRRPSLSAKALRTGLLFSAFVAGGALGGGGFVWAGASALYAVAAVPAFAALGTARSGRARTAPRPRAGSV